MPFRRLLASCRSFVLALLVPALLAAVPAAGQDTAPPATVTGTVTTAGGLAIEGARVEPVEGAETTATDARGRFTLRRATPPLTLVVEHPRFQPEVVEVAAGAGTGLAIVLRPKQDFFEEEIVVSAGRDLAPGYRPVSVAGAEVKPDEKPAPPRTVVELIEGTPGVAENGQGGVFQVYSIRGTSRQRVLTQVDGMKIVSERRAGQSAHFVDPLLLDKAEVLRGPSSSYYGSGALGGVVQLFPRDRTEFGADLGWSDQGDERWVSVGSGGPDWSAAVTFREADDAETPDGERLYSRFERLSAALEKTFSLGDDLSLRLLALPSLGDDIGKPNREFPGRTTTYRDEEHLLVKAELVSADAWRVYAWAHPNSLTTEVVEAGEAEVVENEAFDFGLNGQREWVFGNSTALRAGVDWNARRGVTAEENRFRGDPDGPRIAGPILTLDDASEDELALYGSVRHPWGPATIEAGGRVTRIDQDNDGTLPGGAPFEARDDSAWTGFVAATLPLRGGFELAANVGTGFRFPTLSERYFTGATGRGEIISNPDLDPERSLALDLGLRYYGDRLYLQAWVFRTEVDDFIERIRLPSGARTFVNLGDGGTLEGFEVDGFYALGDGLRLTWSGQTIDGEAGDGSPLGDVPADRITLGAQWRGERVRVDGRWQHRFEKDDPGPSEVSTGAAEVVSAAVDVRVLDGLWVSLTGDNLLDETYLPSADDQSVPAAARSFGLGLRWSP